ncbi:Peroxisomal membrane protein PEX16 [Cytospora mali]|uniref:Peroxisomal membrane protein PEX16 n=1 Tax=Cytospora mali TaxID=578113 RepID=A0A194UWU9_CYTMA|nr:Peroxisomal membrane protein PEX16 [Valsa mali var. pyri (nom. inval.)]
MSTPADIPPTKTKWSPPLSNVRSALALPPKWLAMYDEFITKNSGQVSQLESALRSLTYIIPGRFRDAELATESIHSSVQLLSLYHDILLFRSSTSPSSSSPATPLSKTLHARYTRFWTLRSKLYRRVAVVLQVVQYTELLLEMWAKRRGEAIRWRVVVLVEAVKALCRLLLLKITRSRPLVTPALPERDKVVDPDEEEEEDNGKALAEMMGEETPEHQQQRQQHALGNGHANGSTAEDKALVKHTGANGNGTAIYTNGHTNGHTPQPKPQPAATSKKEWTMPRTGQTLPTLPQRGDISTYLQNRVLTADDIKPATKLLSALRGSAHTAEVLHILSPLIYAIALSRCDPSKRRSSWTPWLVGLSVQLAARHLAARAQQQQQQQQGGAGGVGGRRSTALEKEEWTRRGRQMWWWVMRGAAYENVTKAVVGGVRRRVPGFVGTILEDYEYLWENYYFSTSDS